jgi:hypothetical protein
VRYKGHAGPRGSGWITSQLPAIFIRLNAELVDHVTIRDFRTARKAAAALSGYGLAVDEAALVSHLTKGRWSTVVRRMKRM